MFSATASALSSANGYNAEAVAENIGAAADNVRDSADAATTNM